MIFDLLPGGDRGNLNEQNWAGIVVEDLIISSYSAWVLNGNQNGYTLPDNSMIIDQTGAQGDTAFPSGIRTPGVFNLPLCTIDQAISNWQKHWVSTIIAGPRYIKLKLTFHQADGSKPQYYPCNS